MKTQTQQTTKYKNSPLGLIPEDWEVKELNEIGVNVIDGDRGKNYPSENEFTSSGYCVFLNAKNVTNQGFAFIDINFITEEKDKELRKGKLFKYDIVLTTRGTVGNISFFDESVKYENLRINSGMVLIRNTKTELIENNFLYKCFTSYVLQQQIDKVSFGSAQPQLTVKEINKFKLPIPPFPEQVVIADCLSTWDKAIEKQNALIAQKELSKKALMQQLLSGNKRLKGFSGNNDFHIIGHYIKEVSDRNRDLKVTRVLSVTNSRGFINQSEQFDRVVASEDASNYKIVRKGQFAYNPSRVNVGSLDLLKNFEEGILSPMYVVFEPIPTKLNSNFLYYHLKSFWFSGHISMFVQGSVRDSLAFDGLSGMKFFIPSIEEQIAIAKVLQCTDDELQLLKKKLEQLKEQKKGLMQVLLTGKKRL